jgi:hypothetical protein
MSKRNKPIKKLSKVMLKRMVNACDYYLGRDSTFPKTDDNAETGYDYLESKLDRHTKKFKRKWLKEFYRRK